MLRNLFDLDRIKGKNYRSLDQQAVDNLVASIREVGLKEHVRLFEIQETGELYVISGHHRLAALRKIKQDPSQHHKSFQFQVTTGTKEEFESQRTLVDAVVSNSLRLDLKIVDRALAYHALKKTGLSAADIARMVGKDRRTIEMTLNVALLPEEALEFIRNNPQLKDAALYRLSAKYKRDKSIDLMEALKQLAQPRARRAGASAQPGTRFVVNRDIARQKLLGEMGLGEDLVEKILQALAGSSAPKETPQKNTEITSDS